MNTFIILEFCVEKEEAEDDRKISMVLLYVKDK
jgi:hypothetical protein